MSFLKAFLKTPVGIIFSVVFLASLSAIIFERALNDLVLDLMNPWSVLGLAVLVLAFIPVVVHRKMPSPPFWVVAGFGVLLIFYGASMGAV
jgi:hypothetical protein